MSRIVVMIDGANTAQAFRQINERANFDAIRNHFYSLADHSEVVHLIYYTAVYEDDTGNRPIQKLLDYLAFNGWIVREKLAKVYKNGNGESVTKGNMDIEIATDMMRAAKYADRIWLFTGDGDFCYVVKEVQQQGVQVVGVSTTQTRASAMPVASEEFRRTVDLFVDLEDCPQWFISTKEKRQATLEQAAKEGAAEDAAEANA